MKNKLLAFAMLNVLAAAAHAQSTVTIYGTVDLGVAKSNGGTANNPTQGTITTSNVWQVTQGRANRLGFRGNEDLGGGLSAQFQIETRFLADTGAQSNANAFWHGQSYVQLSHVSFGKVYMGRVLTPGFLLAARMDPFGWDGVGEMGNLQYGNYRTPDPSSPNAGNNGRSNTSSSVRESNTVGYVSPSFSGFSAHATTSLSEATQNGRVMSLAGQYEAGPLFVGLAAERVYKGNFAEQGIYQLGASYNFGFTKINAYFARSSYGFRLGAGNVPTFSPTVTTPGGANIAHAKVYQIGAVTPVGGGAIKAGYIRMNPDGPNNLAQKLGIGYDYFLSKRTKVYIDGSYAKEDTRTNSKLVSAGVRHDF